MTTLLTITVILTCVTAYLGFSVLDIKLNDKKEPVRVIRELRPSYERIKLEIINPVDLIGEFYLHEDIPVYDLKRVVQNNAAQKIAEGIINRGLIDFDANSNFTNHRSGLKIDFGLKVFPSKGLIFNEEFECWKTETEKELTKTLNDDR